MRLNLTPTRPLTATFDILEARARNRLARLSSAAIRSELKDWSARAGCTGGQWMKLAKRPRPPGQRCERALERDERHVRVTLAADLPLAFIVVRDTGAVGARILIDPRPHVGKTYEFTGAQSNYAEFAEVFSQVLGRKITYVPGAPPTPSRRSGTSSSTTRSSLPGTGMICEITGWRWGQRRLLAVP
jgi:hypothetical protein